MGEKEKIKIPRVVLDTNCVLSALLFTKGHAGWLRDAWLRKRFVPLVSRSTATELMRVLAYPKFKLDKNDQEILLSEYLPYAEVVTVHTLSKKLPGLNDPDDLMFLQLAVCGKADALVSGDAYILAVKNQLAEIPVLSIGEFEKWLGP